MKIKEVKEFAFCLFTFALLLSSGCALVPGPDVSGDGEVKKPATDSGGRDVIESIDFVNNRTYKDESLQKKLDFKVGDYLDPVLAEAGGKKGCKRMLLA